MDKFPIKATEASIFTALLVTFFLLPYLPDQVLLLTDFLLVRIALLIGVIMLAYKSPIVGIVAFVLVAYVFIQRNKVKVMNLQRLMQQSDEESPAIASIVTPETAPVQPPFETPAVSSVPFFPQEDSGDNMFHAIAESMNEKHVLPTETVDGSGKAIQQLYRWVDPELVQAP